MKCPQCHGDKYVYVDPHKHRIAAQRVLCPMCSGAGEVADNVVIGGVIDGILSRFSKLADACAGMRDEFSPEINAIIDDGLSVAVGTGCSGTDDPPPLPAGNSAVESVIMRPEQVGGLHQQTFQQWMDDHPCDGCDTFEKYNRNPYGEKCATCVRAGQVADNWKE